MSKVVCGGLGNLTENVGPEDRIHEIVSKLKEDLTSHINEKLGAESVQKLEAVSYKTQIVAGTNFFVKIRVSEAHHVHARIYRNLQGEVSLHTVSGPKTAEDEIDYIE